MSEPDEANQDYESPAILLDRDNQPLASVKVKISPRLRCGDFRLPSSIDVHLILTKTASLQTKDGKRFRLTNLKHCTSFHSVSPGQPHLEFDYLQE